MHGKVLLTALFALALVSAGCLGGAGEDETVAPTSDDSSPGTTGDAPAGGEGGEGGEVSEGPPPVRVFNATGTFTAEVVNSGLNTLVEESPRAVEVEDVSPEATAIIAEVRWTGQADMDLYILGPSYCPVGESPQEAVLGLACLFTFFATGESEGAYGTDRAEPSVSQSYLRVEVGPDIISGEPCQMPPCDWAGMIHPNAAVNADYDLRVTVFTGMEPPADYTAFA